ncbi:hypothetical protein TNCV_4684001 [Trichonephila clavipes]|nr:hypothetical protein TNCV_4684001 [Trichonephila clavipes]
MEWETSYIQVSEPMDWEDIPQVRASKRPKVSEPLIINFPLQEKAVPPQPKKVSLPLQPMSNLSFQVKLTSPTPKQVSPFTSEFVRHKIRCKPKVLWFHQLFKDKYDVVDCPCIFMIHQLWMTRPIATSCGMTSARGNGAIVYCLNSGSEDRQTGRHNSKVEPAPH